jgi:hypothetical protein
VADYMSTPDSRQGQPRTNKRQCGIQPAHQSLITDVFIPLPDHFECATASSPLSKHRLQGRIRFKPIWDRYQVPPSPLYDPSPNQLHAGEREELPVVPAWLDKGHQRDRLRFHGDRLARIMLLLRESERDVGVCRRLAGGMPDRRAATAITAAMRNACSVAHLYRLADRDVHVLHEHEVSVLA